MDDNGNYDLPNTMFDVKGISKTMRMPLSMFEKLKFSRSKTKGIERATLITDKNDGDVVYNWYDIDTLDDTKLRRKLRDFIDERYNRNHLDKTKRDQRVFVFHQQASS